MGFECAKRKNKNEGGLRCKELQSWTIVIHNCMLQIAYGFDT